MNQFISAVLIVSSLLVSNPVWAQQDQPTVVDIKRMSLDVALRIGKAAIAQCRKEGVQVAVTVVDRGGHPQVVLRDVLAQDLTLRISKMKAYTAMSFNTPTSQLEGRFKSPFSIGKVEGLVMSAGGVPVQASGNIIGGVGVSGAPSGEIDEKCANAGVHAVIDDLEMATM
jgi:uncharacterized protein GlcG (DUF336 family)